MSNASCVQGGSLESLSLFHPPGLQGTFPGQLFHVTEIRDHFVIGEILRISLLCSSQQDTVSQACLSCRSASSLGLPVSYMYRETLSGELSYKYKSVLGTVHSSLDYCRVRVDSAWG